ncbi:hypothetical protein HDC90_001388 [Pedobacter sp. AK013]|uniref:hypothetical protein n=1 Tax=Pedobacter sp. AK013 TaxID=2723071 RepID=UPI00161A58A9|nr:hypothetical protein [Pedobacter sp. AK013]MBB6236773.1 hypothetical protein [Pedobacter sp. AK013]
MEEKILDATINGSKKIAEKNYIQTLPKLLESIEKGEISTELVIMRLFETVVELEKKLDSFSTKFTHLADIARKITEIHALHFPSNSFLKKEDSLKAQYLAQILLDIPRKRKRSKLY